MPAFGSEQSVLATSLLRRLALRVGGDLHFGFRMRARYLAESLPDVEGIQSIFEAGCYRGQTSFWLRHKFPKASILSIDIDPALIGRCQKISELAGTEHIQFRLADLTNYREENQADLVVCFDVLEHIKDFHAALRTLARQTAPHGTLILHIPQSGRYQDTHFGLRKLRRNGQVKHSEHEHEGFVPGDFALLRDLGFEYEVRQTFGRWVMTLHTFFEIYRGHSRAWWIVFSPLLLVLSRLEMPGSIVNGGGLLVIARRPDSG
jgi:SAM-dependent methyltransferase